MLFAYFISLKGTMFTYTILYVIAFGQLYTQFEEAHVFRTIKDETTSPENIRWSSSDETQGFDHDDGGYSLVWRWSDKQIHTAVFLLALSYIVYCTMKIIQLDTINQVRKTLHLDAHIEKQG